MKRKSRWLAFALALCLAASLTTVAWGSEANETPEQIEVGEQGEEGSASAPPTELPDGAVVEQMEEHSVELTNLMAPRGTGVLCSCGGTSTNTLYAIYDDSQHAVGVYCNSCGELKRDVYFASHSFGGGDTCVCGYTRAHTHSWSTRYDGNCVYTSYCSGCGATGSSYVSHSYSYGGWSQYNGTQHQRSYSCSSCGAGPYTEYADHSLTTGYGEHDLSQHTVTASCTTCGYNSITYEDHQDANGDELCDTCGQQLARFSVTIPTALPLAMDQYGGVHISEAAIVNSSTAAVKVSGVTVQAQNGWTLAPYASNMAQAKVDSRQIGFAVNGAATTAAGDSAALFLSVPWTIARDGSLPLAYDAVLSPTSRPITNQAVLTVTFVVEWAG